MCLIIPYKNSWYLGQKQRDGTLLSAEGRPSGAGKGSTQQKTRRGGKRRDKEKERKKEGEMGRQKRRKWWKRIGGECALGYINITWTVSCERRASSTMGRWSGVLCEGVERRLFYLLTCRYQALKPRRGIDSGMKKMFLCVVRFKRTRGETTYGTREVVCRFTPTWKTLQSALCSMWQKALLVVTYCAVSRYTVLTKQVV